jgi:hypothetical protein
MFPKVVKVIREIHSEPAGGTLSWGRVAASFALLSAVVWVSRLVFLTHSLPALDGITGFVVGPYAANKVATAAQAYSNNPVTTAVPPAQFIPQPAASAVRQ